MHISMQLKAIFGIVCSSNAAVWEEQTPCDEGKDGPVLPRVGWNHTGLLKQQKSGSLMDGVEKKQS